MALLTVFCRTESVIYVKTTTSSGSSQAISLEPPGTGYYPVFNLSRNANDEAIIHLPSGEFIVRGINYTTREIRINDPDSCLPGKLLSLNLSGTPFRGAFYQDFTFFNCSPADNTELEPIACLSNNTSSVFATYSSPMAVSNLFESCDMVKTVSVPVPVRFQGFGEVRPSNLDHDLLLQWDLPGCQDCESRGGSCVHSSGLEYDCVIDPQPGFAWNGSYKDDIVGIAVPPAVLCIILLACFLHIKLCRSDSSEEPNPIAIVINHPEPIIVGGLDHETLESYPKVVLGDSGHLPNPDESTCPICLSEFKPGEILKTLLPCQHSFHARGIDEWLLQNVTCPVCRAVCQTMK